MTISQTQLAQALSEPEIKKFWLGYFQEGFRQEIQQQLLEIFESLKETTGLTRSDLARKIGRRPEQVTRWLSSSTNMESDTISDMALGLGMIPKLTFELADKVFAVEKPVVEPAVGKMIQHGHQPESAIEAFSLRGGATAEGPSAIDAQNEGVIVQGPWISGRGRHSTLLGSQTNYYLGELRA